MQHTIKPLAALLMSGLAFTAVAQTVPGMPVRPLSTPREVTPAGGASSLAAGGAATSQAGVSGHGTGAVRTTASTMTDVGSSSKVSYATDGAPESPVGQRDELEAASLAKELAGLRSKLGEAAGRRVEPSAAGEIVVKPGRSEVVRIARTQLNRFVVPFANPFAKTASTATTLETDGQVVYVASNETEPFGVMISDEDNPVNAIALTLIPQDIPAISTTLRVDGYLAAPLAVGPSAATAAQPGEDAFVHSIRETFRSIATGSVPGGFGLKTIMPGADAPDCFMPGLKIEPAQEISNAQISVYVQKVTNTTKSPAQIDESRCASDRVIAVAAWPYVELMPMQSTELYIAVRREPPTPSNQRPSVL